MTFAFYRKWELWMFFITWKQSQIVSKVYFSTYDGASGEVSVATKHCGNPSSTHWRLNFTKALPSTEPGRRHGLNLDSKPAAWTEVAFCCHALAWDSKVVIFNNYFKTFFSHFLASFFHGSCGHLAVVYHIAHCCVALWPSFVTVFRLKQIRSLALMQPATALSLPAASYEIAFLRPLIAA